MLEDRRLLAVDLPPLLDINTRPVQSSSSPQNLVDVGGTVFFTATTATSGSALWKSDGTDAGTVMVKDINVGGSSYSRLFANVDGTLYFRAFDATNGYELWKSDGTAAGTVMVKDIVVGSGSAFPNSLTNVNGTLYFRANDGINGEELWKSDGTAAGTVMVKDIRAGSGSSSPRDLTNVDGTLYFSAFDATNGDQLWKSDGTAAGTVMVKDIVAGSGSSSPRDLTNVNGTLYFRAFDGIHGFELWKSDGTATGTVMVKDIRAGSGSSSPRDLTNVDGTLYFVANDGINGLELWKSDGTAVGTEMVKDILAGSGTSSPRYLTNVNGTLYFRANDGTNGYELWKSDGTAAGTVMVKDILAGSGSAFPNSFTNFNGTLYFSANDGTSGRELWRSDGTAAGTVLALDVASESAGSNPAFLTATDEFLFFAALTDTFGNELYAIPLPQAPTGLSLSTPTVDENLPVESAIGVFNTTDPNTLDTHTYTLASGSGDADNASFTINGGTLKSNAVFDFETKPAYSIRVRTTDAAGLFYEQMFTIQVNDNDEIAPTVLSISPTLNDGVIAAGTTSLTIAFSEPIIGGDVAGNFELRNQGTDGILGNADDELVTLAPAYSSDTTVLTFAGLNEGVYRLTTADSVTDLAGNALDGDEDGNGSGNYRRDFVVGSVGSSSPQTLLPSFQPGQQGAQFGWSVAMDGNYRVVGAPFVDFNGSIASGIAYVFESTTGALVATLTNPTPGSGDRFGASVAVSGNTVVVGAYQDDTGASNSGSAYVFNATTGALVATLANPTPAASDNFGTSVAVSGNTVVVGAHLDDTGAFDSGSAYVFHAVTGALVATLTNPSPASSDYFGISVAVSGNIVVVGAERDDTGATDSGSAYVFNATTGAMVAALANPTPTSSDSFGTSVAVSGNTVVVGAVFDDTGANDSGSAYVFNASSGALVATLANPTPASLDRFGNSVAVSGNTVVVGGFTDDTGANDSGSAYVFNATTGALVATLANPTPASADYFGASVAVSNDTVVVGAYRDDTARIDSGSAYVFNATTGTLIATLANPSPPTSDSFGASVAMSGNTVIVGAAYDDTGAINSGSAYVFNAITGAPVAILANPSSASNDQFGSSVSVSGNTVVVGAYRDDTGATDSGSAYVFNATTGSLVATLANPASVAFDFFGSSVAVSGNTVVVGAHLADTGATDSGSAYVFNATTGAMVATLANPTPASNDYFGFSVAVSGNTVVVGAHRDDTGATDSGSAYVFDATTGALVATLVNPTPASTDWFGYNVAVSGSTVVVGAYRDDTGANDSGSVYVFDANTGTLIATLVNPAPASGDGFGYSVAVSGNTVVVGAYQDDTGASNTGSAYVFNATTGALVATRANPTPAVSDNFGSSVAVSGDTFVVGAYRDDTAGPDQGASYTFSLSSTINLQSVSGKLFDVDGSSFGTGQLVHGTNNAFDGLNRLQVDGVDYASAISQATSTDDGGRTVVTPIVAMSGLDVFRAVTVPETGSEDFARTIDSFTNSSGTNITVPIRIVGNLGSDLDTTVFATSDGDTIVEPTDSWFGTDDADGSGTPAIIHLLRNANGIQPTNVQVIGDNVVWDYSLTVPAGQTVRLAHFTVLADTRAAAIVAAGSLTSSTGFTGQAGAFLTPGEIDSLANFVFNQAPTDLLLSATVVDENQPVGTTVGNLTAIDADTSDAHSFTLVGGTGDVDNASFTISGSSLKTNAVFDFETKSAYSIRVRTTDAAGLFYEQTFTIQVNDNDEIAPTVLSISPTLNDGVIAAGTTLLTIAFSEPIIGGDVAGNFELRNQGADGILGNADDELVTLAPAYSNNTTVLTFAGLNEGIYRLTIADSVTDVTGNALDGDEDGNSSGDYRRDFVVGSVDGGSTNTFLPTLQSGQQGSAFGRSVAIDGNYRVVGVPLADLNGFSDSGVVYVFDATTGELVATLVNPTPAFSDNFGSSVAVSGNTVVVGANRDDTGASNSGSAYLFNATTGELITTLGNPTPASNDNFGSSVSVSGNIVVVGANLDDTGAINSGSAYLFNATTGALISTLANPTPASNDNFGFSVAVSGNTVVVGAYGDDTGATDRGSAYLFNATTGTLVTSLANPYSSNLDSYQFGYSVAASGNTVVVGAYKDNTGYSYDRGGVSVFNATSGALISTLTNPNLTYEDWFGSSVSVSGNNVVVGAYQDDNGATNSGSAFIFNATTGGLVASLTNPTPDDGDGFGFSVAASGNTLLIGDRNGSAYVFNTTTGVLLATLADPTAPLSEDFGISSAISGNIVVVGALYSDIGATDSGSVYVFNATTGLIVATLANPTPAGYDYFGYRVAVSGDSVVVGAFGDDIGNAGSGSAYLADSGSAYLFNVTTGTLVATLANPTPASNDLFGISVAVSGNTVVVGAQGDDTGAVDSGSAYVYNATTGVLVATLANPTPGSGDFFGRSVAVSGNTVVVGAMLDDAGANNSGSVYIFDATTGTLIATLTNPTPSDGDLFGSSVAISGDTVVVGAYSDDAGGTDNGIAYLYNATTGALVATLDNPTPASSDLFGYSVAISGNNVVIGADRDDTDATDSGSVYVFDATTGVLIATLANPTPAIGDIFGNSVGVSGNTVVIGAYRDDTAGFNQGAAYTFSLPSTQNLHSASGKLFDVDGGSFGTGQLVQGTNNAFDGLNRLQVDGVDYTPTISQTVSTDDNGRTVVTPIVAMSGLDVFREVTVPDAGSEDFARTIDSFTNSTGTNITVPVRIVGNLGSDLDTTVFATSDGDTIVEPTDSWFGTDDADGTGTPAIIHLLRNANGIQPTNVQVIGDNVVWDYWLTVPAGQTVRLAHFTVLADTRTAAITAVGSLTSSTGFTGQAGAFLTPGKIDSLANFVFNQAPTDLLLSATVVDENQPVGTTVGNLTAIDADTSDAHSFTLVGGTGDVDNASFTISGSSLKTNAVFDFETKPAYSIRVRATDQGGLFYDKPLTIVVNDVPEDSTPPSAVIAPLPLSWSNDTIVLNVTLIDPAGALGEVVSGVASYDVFVAVDSGGWSLYAADMPASQTQVTYTAQSDHRYWFRAVAKDAAGNVESDLGLAEANTRTLDFTPPTTSIVSSTTDDVTGQITLQFSGTDIGGSGLREFQVYVSVDGSTATAIVGSPIAAGASIAGLHSGSVVYQGLRDGQSHSYRFYSVGVDGRANVELAPANNEDLLLTTTFSAVASLQATGIDVQQNQTQRSFIQHVSLLFNDAGGLASFNTASQLHVERFAINAASALPGTGATVSGATATKNGNSIGLNFGSSGIGGAGAAGNGLYRVSVDTDGDGLFDSHFEFFRLFGDANGDGVVNDSDQLGISEDLNGDGRIDSRDRRDARAQRNRAVDTALLALIDD